MQKPIINLNGDNKATLADEAVRALNAISAALEAINGMTVHGRNYPGDYAGHRQAVEDITRIYTTLQGISAELVEYYTAIIDQ